MFTKVLKDPTSCVYVCVYVHTNSCVYQFFSKSFVDSVLIGFILYVCVVLFWLESLKKCKSSRIATILKGEEHGGRAYSTNYEYLIIIDDN